jgi:hypothetical protein
MVIGSSWDAIDYADRNAELKLLSEALRNNAGRH